MNGAEHYRHAQNLITTRDDRPQAVKAAQVHALLAIAAALGINEQPAPSPDPLGDGDDFQWGTGTPGALERNKPGDHWPPRRGDLWSDYRGRTWVAVPRAYFYVKAHGSRELAEVSNIEDGVYLVCLDMVGNDFPDPRSTRPVGGPMRLVFRPSLLADCPF